MLARKEVAANGKPFSCFAYMLVLWVDYSIGEYSLMSYTGCSRLPQSKAAAVGESQEDQWAPIDRVGEFTSAFFFFNMNMNYDKENQSLERQTLDCFFGNIFFFSLSIDWVAPFFYFKFTFSNMWDARMKLQITRLQTRVELHSFLGDRRKSMKRFFFLRSEAESRTSIHFATEPIAQ